jgi:uncharacterized protein YndB with AHSA1/START domain
MHAMPGHSRTLTTTASPETVWKIWSDPTTWGDWNPDVESCILDGPLANGASGTMRTKSGGQHAVTIESVVSGKSFTLVTQAIPLTRFAFTCSVGQNGDATTITQALTMRGALAAVFSPMMGSRIAESFEPILRGLKERAEAEPS